VVQTAIAIKEMVSDSLAKIAGKIEYLLVFLSAERRTNKAQRDHIGMSREAVS
jgi:hypothetical protein